MCGTTIVDVNVGRRIGGRYQLGERIGVGALGPIYAAEQLGLGRKLAIKLLPPDQQRDFTTIERFIREGEVLCRLRSPHTVTTYEFGRDDDGTLYIAMERPSGKRLSDVIEDEGALAWPRVLKILRGLCDSLVEAHELGVVHRELKPENILLEVRATNPDFVKVLDFGLAKLLRSKLDISPVGQTIGVVEYSSPEQLMRQTIDARSDLYALGVLGFVLVTGRHPFEEDRSYGRIIEAHVRKPAPLASSVRADVPGDVDVILARLLEKDPARRFPDATALSAMIDVLLASQPAEQGETIRTPGLGEEDTVLGEPLPDLKKR